MLRTLCLSACLAPLVFSQSRSILESHPRILVNSSVPDTWDPAEDRLTAIVQRIRKKGAAQSDFNTLQAIIDSGTFGHCSQHGGHTVSCESKSLAAYGDNAGYLAYAAPAFLYLVHKGMGDVVSANTYADLVIDAGLFDARACWNRQAGCDQSTDAAMLPIEGIATAADWVWPRLKERGLAPNAVAVLKQAYAQLADSRFQYGLRESDFHNYSVGWWSAMLALGLVLEGEDPAASEIVGKAWGIIDEGYPFSPTSYGEKFTYKLKASIDLLTGGAMNWEGPRYWRSAVPEIVRSIEAYDTATNRRHQVWSKDFPSLYRAALYKIYVLQPDGRQPGLGDSSTGDITSGRDNYGMVILLDRFKDRPEAGCIKTYIDHVAAPWDAGQGGPTGLLWKLIFYPYGAVAAKPYTTLPLAEKFGNDHIIRTGWGPKDTYFVMQAGFSGAYHRGMEQGAFHLFGGGTPLLLKGGPYVDAIGYYFHQYFRRTIAANGGLLIYDPSACWRDNSNNCTLSNDGGQILPFRRHNPPFTTHEYEISRLWTATILEPAARNPYPELFGGVTSGLESGPGYGYIKSDLTKAYSNQWSGNPDDSRQAVNQNPPRRVSLVTRDVIMFTGSGHIIMFDRINATRSSFAKSLVLHSINAPKIGDSQSAVGDKTYPGQNPIVMDNGSGRVSAQVLLPSAIKVRVSGGNACRSIRISAITSSPQATVTTAAPHELANGEVVGIVFNTRYGQWANFAATTPSYNYLSAEVTSPTTFRLKKLNGAYLDTSAYRQPPPPATLAWHENCGYEAIVDDFPDPLNSHHRVRKNAWIPQADYAGGLAVAQFRTEIQPSAQNKDDRFLVVYQAGTTSAANNAPASLVESADVAGAFLAPSEMAVFGKNAAPLRRVEYSVSHAGTCLHVVSGLMPNTAFTVQQNGATRGTFTTSAQGALSFTESGGGSLVIAAK